MTIVDSNISKSDPELIESFKGAMGLLSGGVTVITTGRREDARGLTATAVCSLSVSPPMMLICVNRTGEARQAITRSGYFCVNVLSAEDRDVADCFAGRSGVVGAEKFSSTGEWSPIVTGTPALNTSLVAIDCEVSEKVESHTHTIFLGQVLGVRFHSAEQTGAPRSPLVYWDRLYRDVH